MTGIINRLKAALTRTSSKISDGIEHIFVKKKLDSSTLAELEDLLIMSDMGVEFAGNITSQLKSKKFNAEISSDEVKLELHKIISELLAKTDHEFVLGNSGLQIILVCGINGSGKTTSIGKLANYYGNLGKKVAVAACDTFRAAAIEQLATWADRANVRLFRGEDGSDPASVAHRAVQESIAEGYDILFIDTAGRLHNKKNLMDELAKIVKVIKKLLPEAPQHSLLVLDGTTGQNAYTQTEQFKEIAGVSGLVITKLDGTAKAGVAVGLVAKYNLPIYFIGFGEKIEDFKPFDSDSFASALLKA